MKIAVISDTHIDKNLEKFHNFIFAELKETDMIIHSGDFISVSSIKLLQETNKFSGVLGNVDEEGSSSLLPEKQILLLNGYRIGLFHGHGIEKNTFTRVQEKFKNDLVDIVIFGHSHMPEIMTKDKVLYINPGSPSNKRKEKWYTYVLLKLDEKEISVELKLSINSFI